MLADRIPISLRSLKFVLPPSRPATIDLARALPTLSVVFGSRRGGIGAGSLPPSVIFLGNVAHCLAFMADENCCCCYDVKKALRKLKNCSKKRTALKFVDFLAILPAAVVGNYLGILVKQQSL